MMRAHQIWYHPNDFEIETDDMNNTKQKKEHTKNKIMDTKTRLYMQNQMHIHTLFRNWKFMFVEMFQRNAQNLPYFFGIRTYLVFCFFLSFRDKFFPLSLFTNYSTSIATYFETFLKHIPSRINFLSLRGVFNFFFDFQQT